jgi:hypothetical protein
MYKYLWEKGGRGRGREDGEGGRDKEGGGRGRMQGIREKGEGRERGGWTDLSVPKMGGRRNLLCTEHYHPKLDERTRVRLRRK